MLVLGIETSCDETSAAVVEDGRAVLSNVIATAKTSGLAGVIPEEAAREQIRCMIPVLEKGLRGAGLFGLRTGRQSNTIDAIAVTYGPGLLGSLLVGTTTARALSTVWGKPLIGVHHTMGHLSSTWLTSMDSGPTFAKAMVGRQWTAVRGPDGPSGPERVDSEKPKTKNRKLVTRDPQFPILTLSASGGHTDLWYRTAHTTGVLLGRTRDDAAGEAFDKGASLLGLPFPGGPSIAKAAQDGNPHAYPFPLPLRGEATPDFSFSGLKTALKYTVEQRLAGSGQRIAHGEQVADLSASYQHAVCAHLVDRILRALEKYPDTKEIHLVGGCSANHSLRSLLEESKNHIAKTRNHITIRWPEKIAFCTDNAAMIAAAAYFMFQERGTEAFAPFETRATIPLELVLTT